MDACWNLALLVDAVRRARAAALWDKVRAAVALGICLRRLRIAVPPGATPPPLCRQPRFGNPAPTAALKATSKLRAATASPSPCGGGWTLTYATGVNLGAPPKAPLGAHPLGIGKRVRTKGCGSLGKLVYTVGGGPRAPVSVRPVVVVRVA